MAFEHYSKQKLNILSSGLDNLYTPQEIKNSYMKYIDTSQPILEFSVIKLFQVNLLQLIKNKVGLSKNFNIAPSEIDRMYYWEYEYMLEEVNNNIKSENERNEKEQAKYDNMNPRSMMNSMRSSLPKTPSISIPKMPSFGQ